MAKKKSYKKHSFKYAQPSSGAGVSATPSSNVDQAMGGTFSRSKTENAVISTTNSDNPYLVQDLARLGIISGSLIVLLVGLWVLFTNTSLGETVYNLYKVGQ